MSVTLHGDWTKAASILRVGPARLGRSIDRAVRKEALLFVKHAKEGFTSQAPGGQAFKPLSPATRMIRQFQGFGGSKALIVTGDLRNSITSVHKRRPRYSEAFVGVLRSATGKNGNLHNIAEIHEFGAGPFAVPYTDAMRKFLFAAFNAGKPRYGPKAPSGTSGSGITGRRVLIITIPPRPFIQPVADKYFGGPVAAARFRANVAAGLGFSFGG